MSEKITIINAQNIEARDSLGFAGKDLIIDVTDYSMVRDGYHTIQELYDHRIELYIALAREISKNPAYQTYNRVWRSKSHSDGKQAYVGWFIMGIGDEAGKQITYHLPMHRWGDTDFADTLEKAPEWDNHTSDDVVERLKTL